MPTTLVKNGTIITASDKYNADVFIDKGVVTLIGQGLNLPADTVVDASGKLPDGTEFRGVVELRKILTSDPDQFVHTVAEKLLTYALGREVQYFDMPAVRGILHEARSNEYRWSSLILGVVKSTPFQMRRARES